MGNEIVNQGEVLLYSDENGKEFVNVVFMDETFWLTQVGMAELFDSSKSNISEHLSHIFEEEELVKDSCMRKFGISEFSTKPTNFYNLDAIIAVGYRVNSKKATRFRQWATKTLKEYIQKGFVLNDELMKNGRPFGKDYFDELLERIREIRASERRAYQKIADVFEQCSYDYDKNSETTKVFYAFVQNKLHYAVTGKTAAELISERANLDSPTMGLTTWKGAPDGKILKSDTLVAKNYLNEKELSRLNRLVTMFIDYAELMAEDEQLMSMQDWLNETDRFLTNNRRKVLDGEDISAEMHNMLRENIDSSCSQFLAGDVKDDWDFGALRRHYQGWLTTDADFRYTVADFDNISREGIADMLYNRGMQILQAKEVRYGAPLMRELERICLLKCVDRQWMDHIDNMDQLRQGIALRGYGQKDPVVEYRIEGFDMFDQMVDSIREDSVKMLLTIEIRQAGAAPKREQVAKPTGEGFVPGNGAPGVKGAPKGQPVRVIKIGRNDPCPCGSGLKWKKCTCAKFHPEGLPTDANED